MSEDFEFTIRINASRETVFDLIAEPKESTKVAHALVKVSDLTRMSATVGTQWITKGGPFNLWKTHFLVTAYERPYRLARRLTGSIEATVEYLFESVNHETKVIEKLNVKRVPWPLAIDDFAKSQQHYLEQFKLHLERQVDHLSQMSMKEMDKDQIVERIKSSFRMEPSALEKGVKPEERVKCSFALSDSSLIKGRDQLTINSELLIAAPPEHVFDIVIRHPQRFWRWHTDRSDPTTQLKISPDWPAQNSFYRYRMRSTLPLSSIKRWEMGLVQMIDIEPPRHALTREYQDFIIGFGKILLMLEWKFEEVNRGTFLLTRHDVVNCSFITEKLIPFPRSIETIEKNYDFIREQGINIIRVCESTELTIS